MRDPRLVALRDRVTFTPVRELAPTRARVIVHANGRRFEAEADTGRPATDLERQWDALATKFFALAAPVIGPERATALIEAIATIETLPSTRALAALSRPEADASASARGVARHAESSRSD